MGMLDQVRDEIDRKEQAASSLKTWLAGCNEVPEVAKLLVDALNTDARTLWLALNDVRDVHMKLEPEPAPVPAVPLVAYEPRPDACCSESSRTITLATPWTHCGRVSRKLRSPRLLIFRRRLNSAISRSAGVSYAAR
jgi:hypothetical protein